MTEIAYALAETWALPSYSLLFNTGSADETGCVYWVTEDRGWRGGAAPRPMRDNKATNPGQFRRANYRTGLVVTWQGHCFGPTPASRALAERKMATIGSDPQSLFEVRCSDSVGTLFSMMELDAAISIEPLSLYDFAFSMQFASPDPRRYGYGATIGGSATLNSGTGGLDWATGGGLNWATGGGLNWGSVIGSQTFTFTNTGTAPTDPVFTISCPSGILINPQVMFQTGQRIRYNGTLAAGDVLVINTSSFNRGAILNGSVDVGVLLDLAEWFQIPVGTSTVTFTAANANAAASLTGTAYVAYY
jgi:Phage tail protein